MLSGCVDDMFDSGRAPPLQPTFSYRRWEGSGVALRRLWWHLVEWQSFSSLAAELGEECVPVLSDSVDDMF